jgi:PAS domain S-box-containing protein
VITRPDGSFDTWSETLPQLVGTGPADVPRNTRDWLHILHPDDRALFRNKAIEAGVKGVRTVVEYRLQRSDGAWIHVQQTMEPLSGETQADTKHRWFNTLQDVTERKLAEAKIRHLNRVYAVLSGINSMIVRVRDRDELFREACRIAVEEGGFKLAWIGLVDKPSGDIDVVSWHGAGEGYIELMPQGRGRNLLGGRNLSVQAITERMTKIANDMTRSPHILLKEESRERGFHSLAILPLLAAGEGIGVLALYSGEVGFFDDEEVKLLEELAGDIAFAVEHLDLDARVKQRTVELNRVLEDLRKSEAELEQRVQQRTAELESANHELEAFSYSVSHDLRAPLRHIDGYAQMLHEECAQALDASGRRYLDVITESVKLMGQLIDDLLLFSKMGRAEMNMARVSMDELVQEVVKTMAGSIGDRKLEWQIESLPEVCGDRAMLKQVWVNLLANSVKYTRFRPLAEIRIGFSAAEGEFHVQDNGAGFDMAYAGKLFGVFQRLHRAEEFEGTGVGLANVQRIITRHGGRIRAQGKVNEGATFHFSLPLHQGDRK